MSRARHALRLACRPPLPLHNCHKPCQAIRTAPVAGQDDWRAIGYACRRQASEDGSALLALPSRRIKAPANLSFRWKEWSSDSGTAGPRFGLSHSKSGLTLAPLVPQAWQTNRVDVGQQNIVRASIN